MTEIEKRSGAKFVGGPFSFAQMVIFKDRIFTATNQGVFEIRNDDDGNPKLFPVKVAD